jgi:hypothetical protein
MNAALKGPHNDHIARRINGDASRKLQTGSIAELLAPRRVAGTIDPGQKNVVAPGADERWARELQRPHEGTRHEDVV